MNKEEIEKELVRARVAETTIKNNIIELLEQLVEAEKPKLGHGDFGIDFDKSKDGKLHFPVIAIKKGLGGSLDIIFRDGSPYDRRNEDGITWLGNIFDLLKEWSEDLEIFTQTGWGGGELKIQIFSDHSIEFRVQGRDATMHLEKAEEFWRKLGQMIATLKRRSPQE